MFWKKKANNNDGTWLVAYQTLSGDLKSVYNDVKRLELEFETLRNFVKTKIKKTSGESSNDGEPTAGDLENLRNAFGGSLPIELLEKYKNQQ